MTRTFRGTIDFYPGDATARVTRPPDFDVFIPCTMQFVTKSGVNIIPGVRVPRISWLARHLPKWVWPFGRYVFLAVECKDGT